MHALVISLALLSVLREPPQTEPPLPLFVAENGSSYSFKEGIVELRGGRTWLRTPKIYLDFWLAFDFRVTAPETDAGVVIRSWTSIDGWPRRGYRLRFPTDAVADATSLFEARRREAATVQSGRISLRPPGEWQQVQVTGAGKQVTIVLNEAVVGVFSVEEFGGHILFDNRKGRVELRNVRIGVPQSPVERPDGLMTFEQVKKAGGRLPTVAREVKPSYTAEAMRRKVQGIVLLEIVVLPDGSIGGVGVVRSLDPDLDQSAIAAVKAWKFKPGLLNGKAISVLAQVEMTFTLK